MKLPEQSTEMQSLEPGVNRQMQTAGDIFIDLWAVSFISSTNSK